MPDVIFDDSGTVFLCSESVKDLYMSFHNPNPPWSAIFCDRYNLNMPSDCSKAPSFSKPQSPTVLFISSSNLLIKTDSKSFANCFFFASVAFSIFLACSNGTGGAVVPVNISLAMSIIILTLFPVWPEGRRPFSKR